MRENSCILNHNRGTSECASFLGIVSYPRVQGSQKDIYSRYFNECSVESTRNINEEKIYVTEQSHVHSLQPQYPKQTSLPTPCLLHLNPNVLPQTPVTIPSDEEDDVSFAPPSRAQTWLEATTAGFRPTPRPALTTHTSPTMSRPRPSPLRPLPPPRNLVHELHPSPPLPIRP